MIRTHLVALAAALAVFAPLRAGTRQASPEPCDREVPEVRGYAPGPWRLVHGKGFTFCLPATWKPNGKPVGSLDARRWSGDGVSVAWGTGALPRRVLRDPPLSLVDDTLLFQAVSVDRSGVREVHSTSRHITPPAIIFPSQLADMAMRRGTQRGGGFWSFARNGKYETGTTWEGPAGYLWSEAQDLDQVPLQMAIFSTLRFSRD